MGAPGGKQAHTASEMATTSRDHPDVDPKIAGVAHDRARLGKDRPCPKLSWIERMQLLQQRRGGATNPAAVVDREQRQAHASCARAASTARAAQVQLWLAWTRSRAAAPRASSRG